MGCALRVCVGVGVGGRGRRHSDFGIDPVSVSVGVSIVVGVTISCVLDISCNSKVRTRT